MRYLTFVSMLLLLIVTGCGQLNGEEHTNIKLNISAAASMTESLLVLKEIFESEHPEIELTYNFGGSGTLSRQIEQGAPTDLFFSASKEDYEKLQEKGKVNEGSIIFKNELVIVSSKESGFDSIEAFYESDKKMAIGTPDAVPAGSYAKEALEKMDVWEALQGRLVLTKDVRQVVTYVNDGVVSAGMVYKSDLYNLENINVLETVESSYHSPIEYFIATIQPKESQNKEKAKAISTFYNYAKNENSMKLFKSYGFQTESKAKE